MNNPGQPMSSIDWLDSLKDGIRLASSYNWDHANTDLTQFQGTHVSGSVSNAYVAAWNLHTSILGSRLFYVLMCATFKKKKNWHSWKLDPHPPPRNANNIEHYTFVTLFPGISDTPHPHLRYVTLEWSLGA